MRRHLGFILALVAAWAGPASADYTTSVVMSGLANPRGLAFGPDGALYVAEAGLGGDGPKVTLGNGNVASLGMSGGVSRLRDGMQERVMSGLPSLAPGDGEEASGLQDIVFLGNGEVYGVIGFGGNPAVRADLGAAGGTFGTLVRLDFAANSVAVRADLAAYELANNPSGPPDSNPFGLVALPGGGFAVADAGANAIWGVSAAGTISTLAVLPQVSNPLPFGPPTIDPVPTTVALDPAGALHVGVLTGFPFPPGGADVFRLDSGTLARRFAGFTTIVDLAFDASGNLFVLELSRNLLAGESGALSRIDAVTGARTTILDQGLFQPTGLALGRDGSIYVSNFGPSPDSGQVLRITAVPEPGSAALLGSGALILSAFVHDRRRRRARVGA